MKKINSSGQGLMEYIILLILVGIVSIAAVSALGTTVRKKVNDVEDKIDNQIINNNHFGK